MQEPQLFLEKFSIGSSSSPFQEYPGEVLVLCAYSTEITLCLNLVIWDGLKGCFKASKPTSKDNCEQYRSLLLRDLLDCGIQIESYHQLCESCMSGWVKPACLLSKVISSYFTHTPTLIVLIYHTSVKSQCSSLQSFFVVFPSVTHKNIHTVQSSEEGQE